MTAPSNLIDGRAIASKPVTVAPNGSASIVFDPVTVAEELRRSDLLEPLGGRPALMRIQGGTPASANAAHYARIVGELALLRRLVVTVLLLGHVRLQQFSGS